mmetsp:Transcript_11659/g.22288  ORF Transcript_11659/g.22288 Transcript_11659/m.22288 type:complete len:263 (+) Transcript_11659:928-1716(+)
MPSAFILCAQPPGCCLPLSNSATGSILHKRVHDIVRCVPDASEHITLHDAFAIRSTRGAVTHNPVERLALVARSVIQNRSVRDIASDVCVDVRAAYCTYAVVLRAQDIVHNVNNSVVSELVFGCHSGSASRSSYSHCARTRQAHGQFSTLQSSNLGVGVCVHVHGRRNSCANMISQEVSAIVSVTVEISDKARVVSVEGSVCRSEHRVSNTISHVGQVRCHTRSLQKRSENSVFIANDCIERFRHKRGLENILEKVNEPVAD